MGAQASGKKDLLNEVVPKGPTRAEKEKENRGKRD